MRIFLILALLYISPYIWMIHTTIKERESFQIYQIQSVEKRDDGKFYIKYKCSLSNQDSFCIIKKDTNSLKPGDFINF